jgi:hypothetical protein
VNFVDPFVRKGYRFAGTATIVERGDDGFDALLGRFRGALAARMRAIVTITVTKALSLTSPAHDDGRTQLELRRAWTGRRAFARFSQISSSRSDPASGNPARGRKL